MPPALMDEGMSASAKGPNFGQDFTHARRHSLLMRAIRSIAYGDRLRDKSAIAFLLALYPLFPLGSAARRMHITLPDPARLIRKYRCRNAYGVFECPGGPPFFLQADPSHDPGVASEVSRLRSGTFVDVGASVGFFTVRAARSLATHGRVLAIEPHAKRFDFLRSNVAANSLENVTCLRVALGASDTTATLYDLDKSFGPHRRDISLGNPTAHPISVNVRTLDAICKELGITSVELVKIDVEGYEPSVLRGMIETIGRSRPDVVFEALTDASLRESSDILTAAGYSIAQIDSGNFVARA